MKAFALFCFFFFGLFFLKISTHAQEKKLLGAEYFFNADPGIGNGIPIPIATGTVATVETQISTAGLDLGFNRLSVRFLDSDNNWGISSSRTFFVERISMQSNPTIVAAEFFFNQDPGFGNGKPVTITPGKTVELTTEIPTSDLNVGFNRLSFRIQDENGVWSLFQTRVFWVEKAFTQTGENIVNAEYFFNQDPGFGNGKPVTITPGKSVELTTEIPTSDLNVGFNQLSFRIQDENGVWSLFQTRNFWREKADTQTGENIVAAEYFFNQDPGFGNGKPVPVTPGKNVELTTEIPTSDLNVGFNRLSFRIQDENGVWSLFQTRVFWVEKAFTQTGENIVNAEYFFNQDPGFGNGKPVSITPGKSVELTTEIPTSDLNVGFNRLSIRIQDENGVWSLFQTRVFWVEKTSLSQESRLIGAEYFIDSDPGEGNGKEIEIISGFEAQVLTEINIGSLSPGFHRLSVRFLTDNEEWSLPSTRFFFVENERIKEPILIESVEYFFNEEDPGFGNATEIPLDQSLLEIDLEALISVANLPIGKHTLSIRIKNDKGLWSLAESRDFIIEEDNSNTPPVPDKEFLEDYLAECKVNWSDLGQPTATAFDGSVIVGTVDESIFPITLQGKTIIVWSYVDSEGRETTQEQLIFLLDDVPPSFTQLEDITVTTDLGSCFANGVDLGWPELIDNCGVVSITNNAPETFPVGITEVIWVAIDEAGNSSEAIQLVTVRDEEKPTISAPGPVTVSTDAGVCEATGVILGTPETSDNCLVADVSNDAPVVFPIGETLVTWTVVDASGNTVTATQLVIVEDQVAPSITAPDDLVINLNPGETEATEVDLGEAEVSDNCTGGLVGNDAPAAFPIGETLVIWTATDASGNSSEAIQRVTVISAELPGITAPADLTVNTDEGSCHAVIAELGTPILTGPVTQANVSNDAPAIFPIGVTQVIWTVTDEFGNSAEAIQWVTVKDEEKPTISAPGPVTVSTDAGVCEATEVNLGTPETGDNCLVADVSNDAPVVFPIGETLVTWTVVDASGNSATATQLVTVSDNEAPTVVTRNVLIEIQQGSTYTLTVAEVDNGRL